MNIVQFVARTSICLLSLCLLFLLFNGTSLTASGASQQVCLPTVSGQPTTPPEQAGTILINEVLLSSKKLWSCPGSTTVPGSTNTSWIELYNPRALPFNLYIAHAVLDGGPGTNAIYFPFGSAIAAHGFLTIFPDESMILNGGAETFIRRLLFNGPNGTVIDHVTIPANLGNGQSYARIPDGGPKWEITNTPTIGSSNVLPTATVKHTLKSSTTKIKSSRVATSGNTTGFTNTSSYIGPTITGENTNAPAASGAQPAWGQMQLPATPSSLPTSPSGAAVSSVDTTTSPPPANNTNADVPRNVLFTGLAIVLVGTLFWWGRRRFMRS